MIPFLSATECGKKKKQAAEMDEKNVLTDSLPSCVQLLIDNGSKEEPPNAPMQVDEYLYNEKTVFLSIAQCCDQFDVLYDEECNKICSPSGGFTGRGDGKCTEFFKEAKLIKTIWKEKKK